MTKSKKQGPQVNDLMRLAVIQYFIGYQLFLDLQMYIYENRYTEAPCCTLFNLPIQQQTRTESLQEQLSKSASQRKERGWGCWKKKELRYRLLVQLSQT